MFDKLLKTTVADIGNFDLYYYDDAKKDDLVKFCSNNGISYLPSKDGRNVYKLENDTFIKNEINKDLLLSQLDLVFEDSTLKKFEDVDSSEIRFIVENEIITGVVHIVDYNNDLIYVELYRAFYRIEKWLRQILIKSGFNNEDFIKWVREKAEKSKNSKFWEEKFLSLEPINQKKE